jgi:aryl-alcohol dehydrogenase-like predicted oxidoreductase
LLHSVLLRAVFLCGELDLAAFDAKDIRKAMPRFTPDNYAANLKLFGPYQQLAKEAGCSPAQLALAWLLHKDAHIIPIPGTTSVAHLLDDLGSAQVKLSADLIAKLNELINENTVVGDRYNDQANSEVDTEVFN